MLQQSNGREGLSGAAMLDFMWEEFHDVHDSTFGFNYRGQQDVELVNLRVRAVGAGKVGRRSKPVRRHAPRPPRSAPAGSIGARPGGSMCR